MRFSISGDSRPLALESAEGSGYCEHFQRRKRNAWGGECEGTWRDFCRVHRTGEIDSEQTGLPEISVGPIFTRFAGSSQQHLSHGFNRSRGGRSRAASQARETIIGEQIQAYIEAHPSAYFEECTKVESYMADLSDLYLEHAAERYCEEQENELLFRYDPHGGDELYQTIVRLIDDESEMERLNALFAERFLRVKPMDLYIQEYTQEFLYSLLYRDMQTDRTVLQILLDRQEP